MTLSSDALLFANAVRKGEKRKYSGDLRTTPSQTLLAVRELYAAGLRVGFITEVTGVPAVAVRNYVANHKLARDPAKFERGVACMAAPGESFCRASWAPHYYVSDLGRVIGMVPGHPGFVLKPFTNPESGYLSVKVVEVDGLRRHNYIHRAVLLAFVGKPPEDRMQGAHGDGNKTNNRLSNLRWDTPAGNAADKVAHGTLLFGSNHPNAKIEDKVALGIKKRLAGGETQSSTAYNFNISRACVANIAQGKTWKHIRSPS